MSSPQWRRVKKKTLKGLTFAILGRMTDEKELERGKIWVTSQTTGKMDDLRKVLQAEDCQFSMNKLFESETRTRDRMIRQVQ